VAPPAPPSPLSVEFVSVVVLCDPWRMPSESELSALHAAATATTLEIATMSRLRIDVS
jgi:hypothetical protein